MDNSFPNSALFFSRSPIPQALDRLFFFICKLLCDGVFRREYIPHGNDFGWYDEWYQNQIKSVAILRTGEVAQPFGAHECVPLHGLDFSVEQATTVILS